MADLRDLDSVRKIYETKVTDHRDDGGGAIARSLQWWLVVGDTREVVMVHGVEVVNFSTIKAHTYTTTVHYYGSTAASVGMVGEMGTVKLGQEQYSVREITSCVFRVRVWMLVKGAGGFGQSLVVVNVPVVCGHEVSTVGLTTKRKRLGWVCGVREWRGFGIWKPIM
ncbi:hypothetical protein Adt_32703 [Abeliophyllum distichum]|uniref:Dirigent protein n=1 Tax=Abeliophyllum distichum TaxID=126358 RepID=A0ABD1QVE8_9LAMI